MSVDFKRAHEKVRKAEYKRLAALMGEDTTFVKKEVNYLPEVLIDGEPVLAFVSGQMAGSTWLVTLTDRRVIFLDKGMLYGLKQVSMSLDKITTISGSTGLMLGKISLGDGGSVRTLSMVPKIAVSKFTSLVRDAIEARKIPAGAIPPSTPNLVGSDYLEESKLDDSHSTLSGLFVLALIAVVLYLIFGSSDEIQKGAKPSESASQTTKAGVTNQADQKSKVIEFKDRLAIYDNLTTRYAQQVTSLLSGNSFDPTVVYSTAKDVVEGLKQANVSLSQEKIPENLPEEVSTHLDKAKEAMGLVIYYRKHASEAFMEYLDDPKPSKSAKIKEYVDLISPAQLDSVSEIISAGALLGLKPEDLFPDNRKEGKKKKASRGH